MPTRARPRGRSVRPTPASYLELVRDFPLRAIRDAAELALATAILDRLLRCDLDEGGRDYLDVLTDLVEKYEQVAHPLPDASEADVLGLLMESHDMSQPELAKRVGIAQSTISAVLTGRRALTKEHVVKLARFFNVSPAVFLPGV